MKKYECYIASGWFNEAQANDLNQIKNLLDELNIIYFSPKDEILCPPNSSMEIQDLAFNGNLSSIKEKDFIIVNTRDKDIGTIFEAGYSFAFNKPIIYFAEGFKGKFNIMLSRSGCAVATSIDELKAHLLKIMNNINYKDEYKGLVE